MDAKAIEERTKEINKAANENDPGSTLVSLLEPLKGWTATEKLLRQTNIGRVMGKLRQHKDPNVARLAGALVSKWKSDVKKVSGSPAPATKAAPTNGATPSAPATNPQSDSTKSKYKGDPEKRSAGADGVKYQVTGNATRDACVKLMYDGLAFMSQELPDDILQVARAVELAAYDKYQPETSSEYKTRLRSLFQNLKNKTNPSLRKDVFSGAIEPKRFVVMTHDELKSDQRKAEDEKLQKENMDKAMVAQEEKSISVSLTCGKCGQKKVSYSQAQTRSADEPMTTFCEYDRLHEHPTIICGLAVNVTGLSLLIFDQHRQHLQQLVSHLVRTTADMDSMRSLDKSLPKTSPQRRQNRYAAQQHQHMDDIQSAFRAAALSVTTLYQSAASSQVTARAVGYQAAVEDLLNFLDKENLGLGDGEGWRIRQWATEKLDISQGQEHESDGEEPEQGQQEEREASVGPNGKEDEMASSVELAPNEHPVLHTDAAASHPDSVSPPTFTFTSSHDPLAAPDRRMSNHDRETGMTSAANGSNPAASRANATRLDSMQRQQRNQRLSRAPNSRFQGAGRSGNALSLAGSKRKHVLDNFFDLSGINFDGKDNFDRGNKRRHI